MCVCTYMCVYTYRYCAYTCICVHAHVCTCVHMCLHAYMHVHVCACTYVCAHLYVCTCVYTRVCIYVCMYIYILSNSPSNTSVHIGLGTTLTSSAHFSCDSQVKIDPKTTVRVALSHDTVQNGERLVEISNDETSLVFLAVVVSAELIACRRYFVFLCNTALCSRL